MLQNEKVEWTYNSASPSAQNRGGFTMQAYLYDRLSSQGSVSAYQIHLSINFEPKILTLTALYQKTKPHLLVSYRALVDVEKENKLYDELLY